MIIIGVDPGTAKTGVGIVKKTAQRLELIHLECIKTAPTDGNSAQRLNYIHNQLMSLISEFKTDILAIETLFFNTNAKSASAVGQAMGAIMVAAAKKKIPVFEYSPLSIKKILTGYGRAEKKVLQSAVRKKLRIKRLPRPTHAADALAVAICHALSC